MRDLENILERDITACVGVCTWRLKILKLRIYKSDFL